MDADKEEMKEAIKEAAREYMSELVREFGLFSIKTLGAVFIVGVLYLALISQGWHK